MKWLHFESQLINTDAIVRAMLKEGVVTLYLVDGQTVTVTENMAVNIWQTLLRDAIPMLHPTQPYRRTS